MPFSVAMRMAPFRSQRTDVQDHHRIVVGGVCQTPGMEPETWVAVAAIAGPIGTVVVSIGLAVINKRNLIDQREADDKRADAQRVHDVANYRRERQAALADEQAARLRADATEFVAVLDEAWRTVEDMESKLFTSKFIDVTEIEGNHRARMAAKKQELLRSATELWTDRQIEHRLSIAIARLNLFGGRVARAAESARINVALRRMKLVVWGDNPEDKEHPERVERREIGNTQVRIFVKVVREVEQEVLGLTVDSSGSGAEDPEPRKD